jgi:acetyl esterase/lipase
MSDKTKFKPKEMELCRVTDRDGDVLIVYKDNTALYEMHSDNVEATYIKWELRQENDGTFFYYTHDLHSDAIHCDYDLKVDESLSFETRLVEAIQMALLGEQIEEVISGSIE